MKIKLFFASLALFTFFACSVEKSGQDLVEATFKVDGMTCQMGCANAIQDKLASLTGVEFADVNFSEGEATVKYSIEIVSKKDIVSEVEQMGGGDKYFVREYAIMPNSSSNSQESVGSDESSEGSIEELKIPTRISFPNIFILLQNR